MGFDPSAIQSCLWLYLVNMMMELILQTQQQTNQLALTRSNLMMLIIHWQSIKYFSNKFPVCNLLKFGAQGIAFLIPDIN